MHQLQFDDKKTFDDWGLYLTSFNLTDPEPKTYYVDIPYSDGSLDLTEAVTGNITYRMRELTAVFTLPHHKFDALLPEIRGYLHGKIKKIYFLNDNNYYLSGRCKTSFQSDGFIGRITISAICKPYRLKTDETILEVSVDGTQEVLIENEQMTTVPKFTTDASVQIVHGANTYSINAGTHTLPIVLEQGDTAIQINGTANVTIAYQEGIL